MYTLKIIRRFPKGTKIYSSVPYEVDEEEQFYELSHNVVIQYHFEELNKDINKNTVVASVISDEITCFIHKTECAYLMNEQGHTVKIIHRV